MSGSAWLPDREPTGGPKPPSARQMAAIIAAVESEWPQHGPEEDVVHRAESVWKFANRWWEGSNIGGRGRPKRPNSFG